jgi:hypothetical protein
MRVLEKSLNVLGGAPANADHSDAEGHGVECSRGRLESGKKGRRREKEGRRKKEEGRTPGRITSDE